MSMMSFALANFVAWSADSYGALMGARILLALAAGLYVPNANALAGALVAPGRRGTALAVVSGGTTVAVALGVPLGALVGDRFGWRLTFAGVGVLALVAMFGLLTGLARNVRTRIPAPNLRDRIAVARRPAVLIALLVTILWATGAYTVYTYLRAFPAASTGSTGWHVGMVLFMWGIAAAAGLGAGGVPAPK